MAYKSVQSDEGSFLLSTLHLIVFTSFLIIAMTTVVRHQLMQLQQISQSYEAKALIEMSETMLREELEWQAIEKGTLHFNKGSVQIRKKTDTIYTLAVTLTNNYSSQKEIQILPVLTAEEQLEEDILEEDSLN